MPIFDIYGNPMTTRLVGRIRIADQHIVNAEHSVKVTVCVLTIVAKVLKFSLVHHSHYKLMSVCVLTMLTEVFSLVYYIILTTS